MSRALLNERSETFSTETHFVRIKDLGVGLTCFRQACVCFQINKHNSLHFAAFYYFLLLQVNDVCEKRLGAPLYVLDPSLR